VRKSVNHGAMKRGGIIFLLASVLVALVGSPAQAHKMWQKPGVIHCDEFDMKSLTGDSVIEKPEVKFYDDKGNLLAAKVSASIVVNAKLIVCVEVDAEAEVNIVLDGILDENKDGKKDTVVVRIDVIAKADVNVKVRAKIKGQVGISVTVALQLDLDLKLKAGEKKSTKCKGKDGVDTY
jgi:hypothetical protein